MLKRTMSALAIAAIAYVGVAQAQESATLTLRSGERISGQLLDLGGVGFTIRVNNEERRIPQNDVAVVDFTGGTMTAADWAQLPEGQNKVWLRNGDTVTGHLYDIGGTTPLQITMKTDSGERVIPSSQIGRIVLAKTEAAMAGNTAGNTAGTSGSGIVVRGNQQWTPTDIVVRQGEVLRFDTTGQIQLSAAPDDTAPPAGATSGRMATGAPIPNSLAGALIGRIGNGQPFGIGNQTSVPMPAAGRLFLGINDDHVADNTGQFRVEITRASGARRR